MVFSRLAKQLIDVPGWVADIDGPVRRAAVAALFAEVSTPAEIHVKVPVRSHRHDMWRELQQVLSKRTGNKRHGAYLRNLLLGLFERDELQSPVTPRSIVKKWNETWNALRGGTR